jgi:hypothetical protein
MHPLPLLFLQNAHPLPPAFAHPFALSEFGGLEGESLAW